MRECRTCLLRLKHAGRDASYSGTILSVSLAKSQAKERLGDQAKTAATQQPLSHTLSYAGTVCSAVLINSEHTTACLVHHIARTKLLLPGNIVVPPDSTMLLYRSFLMSTSHFMMESKVVS
eukprot:GHUV01050861.1.p1 GENE.GHUV01050861.1~~GHUV01050861.1.p1  ORF type:complete len:121 (-),score=18.39 GHUV01050861.1:43-405(-)